jgi:hypothetical protein
MNGPPRITKVYEQFFKSTLPNPPHFEVVFCEGYIVLNDCTLIDYL